MAKLFDTFKGYGLTVGIFFFLTLIGIAMDWSGHSNGKEVWQTFGMALAAFINHSRNADDAHD